MFCFVLAKAEFPSEVTDAELKTSEITLTDTIRAEGVTDEQHPEQVFNSAMSVIRLFRLERSSLLRQH